MHAIMKDRLVGSRARFVWLALAAAAVQWVATAHDRPAARAGQRARARAAARVAALAPAQIPGAILDPGDPGHPRDPTIVYDPELSRRAAAIVGAFRHAPAQENAVAVDDFYRRGVSGIAVFRVLESLAEGERAYTVLYGFEPSAGAIWFDLLYPSPPPGACTLWDEPCRLPATSIASRFMNEVENGIKALDPGSRLEIVVRQAASWSTDETTTLDLSSALGSDMSVVPGGPLSGAAADAP